MLGISPERLNEMRQAGDIHGLRDGSSWKFKLQELERVAEEMGITLGPGGQADEGLLDVGDLGPAGASELVLDLEDEGGDSPTTVGKEKAVRADDSELKLESEAGPGSVSGAGDSHVSLVPEGEGSALDLGGGASDVLGGTGVGHKAAGGSGSLEFEGSDLGLASDLSLGDDQELSLSDDEQSSTSDVTVGEDQELALDEDDSSVLAGGSDLKRGAGDTGINLAPSDSGLNLEEVPLDLAGSSVSSLELPEDDDIVALEDLEAGPDEATQLKADEDFQLAPSAGVGDQDEEDSGSQVIPLEVGESFGLPGAEEGVEPLIGAEGAQGGGEVTDAMIAEEAKPVTMPREFYAAAPEMPYSVWNVLSLLVIVLLLSVTGMLMTDVIRNIWSWDTTFSASTPIMDAMIRMLGMEP